MSFKSKITAVALAVVTAGTANAATIEPTDFDTILTEGKRVITIGGSDVRGVAGRTFATTRNNDIGIGRNGAQTFDAPESVLVMGNITTDGDQDQFAFRGISGTFDLMVNDLVSTAVDRSRTRFDIYIDGQLDSFFSFAGNAGVTMSDMSLGSYTLDNQTLAIRARGIRGTSLYDLTIAEAAATVSAIAPVPLPAGGLLLLTGLGGMAALRRRKKA